MSEVFIPFGTQYYRAPTPRKSEWEKDITNIKNHGFNTIKIWVQWRWNCPKEDKYYFDDIDELMTLAEKNNLKVILNVIFDVAPAWFFLKYPNSLMVKCDGSRLEPMVPEFRQIGGFPGPCYNNPDAIKEKNKFMEAVAKRYSCSKALYIWDLWNEPEIGLRKNEQSEMLCYCPHCSVKFKEWLKLKYLTIESLNFKWNRNYQEWEEVELPRSGNTYNDMIDWRLFFSETLTNELERRVLITKKYDESHPVMIHTVPIPYFNMVSSCNNDYQLAKLCDVFGNTLCNSPFPATINTSSAGDKPVINAEIHALPGMAYDRFKIPSFNDIKSNIIIGLARGVKGFIYWQYRPEILGKEGPNWGLTTLDGQKTDWLDYNIKINNALQENAELINKVVCNKSKIAVINSLQNQIFDWCNNNGNIDRHYNSVLGAYMSFYNNNYNADIVTLEMLTDNALSQYKIIYYPFPYYMDDDTASKLKKWVCEGGMLISEAFFGAYNAEDGCFSTTVPGYGFDEVFGVKEEMVLMANVMQKTLSNNVDCEDKVNIIISEEIGELSSGTYIEGSHYAEVLGSSGAKIIAKFENNMPAISVNNYGVGKAVLCGSLVAYSYSKDCKENFGKLIEFLVDSYNIKKNAIVKGGKVRVDVLSDDDGGYLVVINNSESSKANINVTIKDIETEKETITNIITDENYKLYKNDKQISFNIELDPMAHEVYKIS